jgi:hypothetical protein
MPDGRVTTWQRDADRTISAPPAGRGMPIDKEYAMSDTVSGLSFEDALAELERIVKGLEGGQQMLRDAE